MRAGERACALGDHTNGMTVQQRVFLLLDYGRGQWVRVGAARSVLHGASMAPCATPRDD